MKTQLKKADFCLYSNYLTFFFIRVLAIDCKINLHLSECIFVQRYLTNKTALLHELLNLMAGKACDTAHSSIMLSLK